MATPGDKAADRMRDDMIRRYHQNEGRYNPPDHIWDPICHNWFRPDKGIRAVDLYPRRCVEDMDVIFRAGSKQDINTAANGLYINEDFKMALDRGYIAIVPDVDLERSDDSEQEKCIGNQRVFVRDWDRTLPKDYKIIVLDRTSEKKLKEILAPIFYNPMYNIRSLAELDGRRLQFRTYYRPRPRYVWWMYLRALFTLYSRYMLDDPVSVFTLKEVKLGCQLWGTRGGYIRWNQMRGFIARMNQSLSSPLSIALMANTFYDSIFLPPGYQLYTALAASMGEDGEKKAVSEGEDEDKDKDDKGEGEGEGEDGSD